VAYFRKLDHQLAALHELLRHEDDWLILINADPDAMAGAMALSRLIRHRVGGVTIARVNEITRPDNLAMVRYLRIPVIPWQPSLARSFRRFAMVDSQPHHNPAFQDMDFTVLIDHHPLPETAYPAAFSEIRPECGTTSTILTEYLYNAKIRPGRRLATALQYGIRTDTGTFGRDSTELDIRAYHFLARYADPSLLTRIMGSEYLPGWLPCFSRALKNLRACGSGRLTSLDEVESPDVLVAVADFFMRVHGVRWVAVCGCFRDTAVVVFRGGLGGGNMGGLASAFADVGSGGGHRGAARAEFAVSALEGEKMEDFVCRRLKASFAGVLPQK
jgi:nanoRNase/pAp phosphatase (c-di-AMP/oligoRNAs hydrolase)